MSTVCLMSTFKCVNKRIHFRKHRSDFRIQLGQIDIDRNYPVRLPGPDPWKWKLIWHRYNFYLFSIWSTLFFTTGSNCYENESKFWPHPWLDWNCWISCRYSLRILDHVIFWNHVSCQSSISRDRFECYDHSRLFKLFKEIL